MVAARRSINHNKFRVRWPFLLAAVQHKSTTVCLDPIAYHRVNAARSTIEHITTSEHGRYVLWLISYQVNIPALRIPVTQVHPAVVTTEPPVEPRPIGHWNGRPSANHAPGTRGCYESKNTE